jgi:hypothetical protein
MPHIALPPRFRLLLLVGLSLLTSCRTYYSSYTVSAADYTLATRALPDGGSETFRIVDKGLRIVREFDRQRPFLGFKVAELVKPAAERRGVVPYSGLLVTETYPESAARAAGVLAGDVLLRLRDTPTVYREHLPEIERGLPAGQNVIAKVLRGQETLDLTLDVRLLTERVQDVQDVPLEAPPPPPRPFAGATLRGVPAVWCERMFTSNRQAVVVTDVEVGSPAWLAGIRSGDVIDQVDGEPVPDVSELSKRIVTRGEAGQPMRWSVQRGPGEAHEGTLDLHDYSGETNFVLPFLVCYENGTFSDSWSLLMGILMRNKNQYVMDQQSRQVQTRNVFSALFGLIRVDSRPDETRVRLLWFIRFDT